MKTIIAGSRGIRSSQSVAKAMSAFGEKATEVVSGCAPGIDRLGELWASMRGIPIKRFPANWLKHGKAAGIIRNREMAQRTQMRLWPYGMVKALELGI